MELHRGCADASDQGAGPLQQGPAQRACAAAADAAAALESCHAPDARAGNSSCANVAFIADGRRTDSEFIHVARVLRKSLNWQLEVAVFATRALLLAAVHTRAFTTRLCLSNSHGVQALRHAFFATRLDSQESGEGLKCTSDRTVQGWC